MKLIPLGTIVQGDALKVLRAFPDQSIQCCVTSPPYWDLRDYGEAGQYGLEPTPEAHVAVMVAVFREVRRVLRDDGVLWINYGDCYANDGKWGGETGGKQAYLPDADRKRVGREKRVTALKPKDLVGMPWRVAFALQADGWYLRSDCIWSKPNPLPESVTDRPTKAHEYVFLLSKRARYFYDINFAERGRNLRTVWEIATQGYPGAHYATFPDELARRCILAGTSEKGACPECGAGWAPVIRAVDDWRPSCRCDRDDVVPCVVLDPFAGSGTTGMVAYQLGREFVGIDLAGGDKDLGGHTAHDRLRAGKSGRPWREHAEHVRVGQMEIV